jgi:hypothetical protein
MLEAGKGGALMDIVITEVTEMSSGNYCVAGWCPAQNRMVRPLPVGHNWSALQLEQYAIAPGASKPRPHSLTTNYPSTPTDQSQPFLKPYSASSRTNESLAAQSGPRNSVAKAPFWALRTTIPRFPAGLNESVKMTNFPHRDRLCAASFAWASSKP